ncbi:MAG: MFS transporter [Legionella sp.]|nr:MFS transporter [Legionella sp.]
MKKTQIIKEEKQQLLIILLIVFMGFIGSSIAYPIFPPLFLHPEHGTIVPAHWHISARSILLGIALAAYPLGQFIGSPILGGYSDNYGRKNLLILSLAGTIFGYLLSALSLQFNWLWGLLISRFLTGIMEGNIAIVRAMATDLSSISKYVTLGRINSVGAIGYVMGPMMGGFLSDNKLVPWFSFAFPFYLAVVLTIIAMVFAQFKLSESIKKTAIPHLTLLERFNLINRLKFLFKNSAILKNLIICSTIFTFSVDIFYEFGPVYLTGLWSITPSGIAIYNAALSFTLAIGAGLLPYRLSLYFSVERVVITSMLLTSIFFGLMVIFPSYILAFILFALVGLSIAIVNTSLTIQVSNAADSLVQGEAMGAQVSLRMLGDALICLIGGFLIVSSVILPIALSCIIALIALAKYTLRFSVKN